MLIGSHPGPPGASSVGKYRYPMDVAPASFICLAAGLARIPVRRECAAYSLSSNGGNHGTTGGRGFSMVLGAVAFRLASDIRPHRIGLAASRR